MAKKLRVAFQGEHGAFSETAARRFFPQGLVTVPCERFDLMFRALAEKRVDAAVVPIENTLHGSVSENNDNLQQHPVRIVAETSVHIVHNLIAAPGVKRSAVRQVYSHPVALTQCLNFFAANPQMERVTHYDTAGSVKMLMEEQRRDAAAIASSLAAEYYGANILQRAIMDNRENYTRFFLAVHETSTMKPLPQAKGAKTSIVFTLRNESGNLFRALGALALRDISLTKIESRPLRGKPFEYLFYVDMAGHAEDARVKNALNHLRELADMLKVLGSYGSVPAKD
jgi:prephenate dehydratase